MKENTMSKSTIYAKKLTKNIENHTIKRKCLPNHGDKYSGPREDLALFQYKRYLGSLRCMLDVRKMREFDRYEY